MLSRTTSRPLPLPRLSHIRSWFHQFSTSLSRKSYADTVSNLRIGKDTRVIYQGFTGRVATTNAQESIKYGTNIVGGVTPGKDGEHLGRPVLPTVKAASQQLKPDATAIFVAAAHAAGAIEDAIEAEIPLIVAVAEHIPLHDILRITSILGTQSKSRLVGANAPGIISPIGHCRIGFQPLPTFAPGHIGIVAKSGTLSYEAVASITRAGLGQSLCIGMGGDIVAGTSLVDGLKVFEHDPETEGIVIIGEVGGRAEEEAADWIRDYQRRVKQPKPIAALIGGRTAPAGRIMGHAGAWAAPGEASAEEKYKALEAAGATMVSHPEKFGGVMKTLLGQAGKDVRKIQQSAAANQNRGLHTMRRVRPDTAARTSPLVTQQLGSSRRLHLGGQTAVDLLTPELKGISVLKATPRGTDSFYLCVTIDRSARQPCVIASPTTDPSAVHHRMRRFTYDYSEGVTQDQIKSITQHLQLDAAPPSAYAQVAQAIRALTAYHKSAEAISITTHVSVSSQGTLELSAPTLHFDPSAFKSTGRQPAIHSLRNKAAEDATEVEAESHGIVYVRLNPSDPNATIGTLVNGAGLAMNTLDALALPPLHGACANFLDTGGKATSQTVRKSFELILADPRVKVVFVNIFGGLTDCGMIADGVVLAFKEVEMRGVPVVVRLRGTNEEVGQRRIADSGLGLEAFDGFAEAARRVVELSRA